MARAEQIDLAGFEQKKIAAIEKWAAKFDSLREARQGVGDEMDNAEFKLREAMHAADSEVDHQESEDGDSLLVYKRGDYNVVVKRGKEKVNVKIGDNSKGVQPEAS